MVKNRLIFLIFFLALIACVEKKISEKSTALKVINENGITLKIYDFEGLEPLLQQKNTSTYVINFWATWCKPCVQELPYFEMLAKHYKNKDVKVVLVSLDMESQITSKLIPFIKKQRLENEVVVLDDADADSWITKVDQKWTGAIPATLIYDNKKRMFYERSFTYKELETELKKFL